jgi:hypothetical protein
VLNFEVPTCPPPLSRVVRASVGQALAGVAQLVEQLIRNQQVDGSSPFAGSTSHRSVLVGLVTLYSEGMGNSFDPNGFSIGSSHTRGERA